MLARRIKHLFCSIYPPHYNQMKRDFNVLETNLEALRKQLIFRSNNMGMKELDVVVGAWADLHVPSLSHEECQQFYAQVIEQETPDIWKCVMKELQDPRYLFKQNPNHV